MVDEKEGNSSESAGPEHVTNNMDYFNEISHQLGIEDGNLTTMDGWTFFEEVRGINVSSQNLFSRFFADLAAKDGKALQNLHEMFTQAGGRKDIGERDLIISILKNCDPFLAQDLLRKLVTCNIAVPVFFTDPQTFQIRFLLWELKQGFKLRYDRKSKRFLRTKLTLHPFMTITAVRFGDINVSKSSILNKLLKSLHGYGTHKNFSKEEPREMTKTLSEGLIEGFWYVPYEKSSIPFPLCLLNLIGDALHHKDQLAISERNSQILIIFVKYPIKKENEDRILTICKNVHVIIALCCCKKYNENLFQGKNVTVLKMSSVTDDVALGKIIRQIKNREKEKSQSFRSLEKFEFPSKDKITDVRSMENYIKAKQLSDEIVKSVASSDSLKPRENFFPLQSLVFSKTVEKKCEKGKSEEDPKLIREEQQQCLLPEEMTKFINITLDEDKMLVKYFCSWLHITLFEKARQNLNKEITIVQQKVGERRRVYASVRKLQTPEVKAWPHFRRAYSLRQQKKEKKDINKSELDAISAFNHKYVGLEHFIREFAEIVESDNPMLTKENKALKGVDIIGFSVEVLMNGHYLDFYDIDASCHSVRWFRNVMNRLQTTLKDSANVRVISVFGGTNSGKSHLLNCLFGTNFPEGEGRCTTGARMALVPVHGTVSKAVGCKFLIVVDTESVSVSESTSQLSFRRNDYISALVCSISDIVIVNIGNDDTQEEISGVLNIFLRGLHSVSEICQEMKAYIVHQYNAGAKEPAHDLIQKKMTRIIDKSSKSQVHLSLDLLNFFCLKQNENQMDINVCTLLRPQISCITKVANHYSSTLKGIRRDLLKILQDEKFTIRLVTEFGDRTSDVLQYIKQDNFYEELKAATEKRKRSKFLSQCEERIESIKTNLDIHTAKKCTDVESLFNLGEKNIDEILSIGTQCILEIDKQSEREQKALLDKLREESIKTYFQKGLSDIENTIRSTETSLNSQTLKAKGKLDKTIKSIKTLNDFLQRWRSKLLATENKLVERLDILKNKILPAKESEIGGTLQNTIEELSDHAKGQIHELKRDISKDSMNIESNTFTDPHLKTLNSSVDSLLDAFLKSMVEGLTSKANEIKESMLFEEHLEEKIAYIRNDVEKNLFATCSEFVESSDNIDEMVSQKGKVLEQQIRSSFNTARIEMQDVIKQSKTISEEILAAKVEAVMEKEVSKVQRHLLKSAEVTTKAKSLVKQECIDQNCHDTVEKIIHDVHKDFEEEKKQSHGGKELAKLASNKFDTLISILTKWDTSRNYKDQINPLVKVVKSFQEMMNDRISTEFEELSERKQSLKQNYEKVMEELNFILENIKSKLPKNSLKRDIDRIFKISFDAGIDALKEKYPIRTLDEIIRETESIFTDRLENLGYREREDFSKFANTCRETYTKTDIENVLARFCRVENEHEVALKILEHKFEQLTDEYINFDTTAKEAIRMIRSFGEKHNLMVEKTILFSFLCARFVSGAHEKHLRAELDILKRDSAKRKLVLGNQDVCDEVTVNTRLQILTSLEGTYVIRFTEPLALRSIEEKLNLFYSLLKEQQLGKDFNTISTTLTPEIVRKYHYLPFTVKTIQTVDSHFFGLLPPLQRNEIINIQEAIYQVKLFIIAKSLTQAVPEIDQLFDDLYAHFESFPRTENNKKTKRASLLHISAWSGPFISVRKYEKEKAENIAYITERQESKCLMGIYSHCNHKYDKLVAKILCKDIILATEYLVEREISRKLLEDLPKQYKEGNLKKKCIVTILANLIEDVNTEKFIQYVHGMASDERWVIKFLAKEVSSAKRKAIENIINHLIEEKVNLLRNSIESATSNCKGSSLGTLWSWLQYFEDNLIGREGSADMPEELPEELKVLGDHAKVNDFDIFSNKCINALKKAVNRIKNKYAKLNDGTDATQAWLLSLPFNTAGKLCKKIVGCAHQCPQCGHPCTNSSASHKTHETSVHIPKGIHGSLNGRRLLLSINCTEKTLDPENNDTNSVAVTGDSPTDWAIIKEEKESLVFWKYVFCNYNKYFANYYYCEEGVPEGWGYSKEAAKRSLHYYFEDLHKLARESAIAV